MTKKTGNVSVAGHPTLKLAEAVEAYVAQGGVIRVVPEGLTRHSTRTAQEGVQNTDSDAPLSNQIERLKGLAAKGAGVTALQYSLRMNRKEIQRLANEHGINILYSRPVRGPRHTYNRDPVAIDDTVAGHAMHYNALGYTVPEIAQLLELSVRDVLNMGKAYRFEFRNGTATSDTSIATLLHSPVDDDERN